MRNDILFIICRTWIHLPSAKLPPHFYVTADKSVPNRISNQAVMVFPIITGHQKAIAVSASELYESAESGIDGDISGECCHLITKSPKVLTSRCLFLHV